MEPSLVIIDDGCGAWGPLTDLRSILDVRAAGLTMRERIERVTGLDAQHVIVPERLRGLAASNAGTPANEESLEHHADDAPSTYLLVNARWLGVDHVDDVLALSPDSALFDRSGALVAAHVVDAQRAMRLAATASSKQTPGNIQALRSAHQLPDDLHVDVVEGDALISRPWHLLKKLDVTLLDDINSSHIPVLDNGLNGVTISRQHPVHIDPTVKFHPCVVIDTSAGPVHIGAHTDVGAMSVLEGPCYIGEYCQITPHTRVRQWTAVGPWCVLGGEISRSIIQGYSNKAHAGYLGNAIVGSWVNLGADTNVSNLKNTYGSVRVTLEHGAEVHDTGLMKQGPLIGDFCRTAIGSRLMTGSCLATGTMLAVSGFGPKVTRRLSFITDEAEQRYDTERFLESARLAMSRRSVEMSAALEAKLRELAVATWE